MYISELEKQRDRLIQEFSEFPIFRPGTLTSRYRKCGKSNCHCADKNSKGHGPSWTITRKVKGKTVAKYISKGMLEDTQKQIENYHRFQDIIIQFIELNVQLCDAQLKQGKKASKEAKKKG